MAALELEHPRLIIRNFLSVDECKAKKNDLLKELEFIHKSNSTVGYRPNVFSTTLSHLIATNSSYFVVPFIPIREKLKDKAEEFFGCEYELFIEFTGLISETDHESAGAEEQALDGIVMITDPTSSNVIFHGGLFHFQDGEPTSVMPMAGDVLMYTADNRNIHSVDEITAGERLTLTLWFSRDDSYDEDAKLVSLLSQNLLHKNVDDLCHPLLASSSMYWFSHDQASDHQLGFDICWARLHFLGFDIYISHDSSCNSDSDVLELYAKPVQLVRGNELLEKEFVNILHALQVVYFYCWKESLLQTKEVPIDFKVVELSDIQRERIHGLKSVLLNDHDLAVRIFCRQTFEENGCSCFEWTGIVAAVAAWEDYASKLNKQIHLQIPYWRTHQSLYTICE